MIKNLLSFLIIVFSLGIATPWALSYRMRYINSNTVINGNRLGFKGTGSQLFSKMVIWILLSLVTFGVYLLWTRKNLIKWEVQKTYVDSNVSVGQVVAKTKVDLKSRILKLEKISALIGVLSLVAFIIVLFVSDSLGVNSESILMELIPFMVLICILGIVISLILGIVASVARISKKYNLVRGIIVLFIASSILGYIVYFIMSRIIGVF